MKVKLARAQALLNKKRPQPDQAIQLLQPLAKKSAPWPVFHLLGIAFIQKREYSTAMELLNASLEKGSEDPATWHSLSICHFHLGEYDKAEEHEKRALDIDPEFFKGWLHLGQIYRSQARLEEALNCYARANQLDPKSYSVAFRIGEIFQAQGNFPKALEMYDVTLKMDRNHSQALIARAEVLQKMGRFAEAEESLHRVMEENPRDVPAKVTLAELYKHQGDYDKAVTLYERMLEVHPEVGGIRSNYALCLLDLGRFEESEENYLRAFKDQPEMFQSLSNYLMGMHYNPKRRKEEIFEAHKLWDRHFAPAVRPERPVPSDLNVDKKLRIGLISGGFRQHPVGWMITKALENLPKSHFEIYCYSTNSTHDAITRRIYERSDKWQSVIGYNDEVLSGILREDEIDILVELCGHAGDTRLKTVVLEPAPIIVKWVGGLFNTTGLEAVDYLITDHYETPAGEEEWYTEKLVRLPDDYICYLPPDYAPEVATLPAKENGYVTFGCFNNPTKVNEQILEKWAAILNRVPKSRLFLKSRQYDTEALRKRIVDVMQEYGISEDRLRFEGQSPHPELLASYNQIDIALDPWPYSGGLTTCEALWMGVPVISKPGPTFAGRHSATHLANAGFPEWVTESWEAYIEKAVDLAVNLDLLADLRMKMRDQVKESPLCDGRRFGAHLAAAFREMWKQRLEGYKKGLAEGEWADHIEVKPMTAEEVEVLLEGAFVSVIGDDSADAVDEADHSLGSFSRKEKETAAGYDSESKKVKDPGQDKSGSSGEQGREASGSLMMNGVHTNGSSGPFGALEQNLPDTFRLQTKDGVTICTPGDLKMLTPYVLLEQGQWFEPELQLLRDWLKPGMTALDIGASFGSYALPMAKITGKEGRVFAFEPGSLARRYLEMSKLENRLVNLEVVDRAVSRRAGKTKLKLAETPELNAIDENGSEEISMTTLDAWWEYEGRPEVHFIKLDVNGDEEACLQGGANLLKDAGPLILFSIGQGGKAVRNCVSLLEKKDYKVFEYIPGPGMLSPFEEDTEHDPYLMNLVAVKEGQLDELKTEGLLHNDDFEPQEPVEGLWKSVLRKQPWTKALLPEWERESLSPKNRAYLQALDCLCAAEAIDLNASSASRSEKTVLLLAAAQLFIRLLNNGNTSLSVPLTLVRVLQLLGKRGQAVELIQELIESTKHGRENINIDLPFMLPFPEQDNAPIKTELHKWLLVRMVEAWILLKEVTTYWSGEQEGEFLKALEGNPEVLALMDKRIKMKTASTVTSTHRRSKRPIKKKFIHICFNHVYAESIADLIHFVNDHSDQEHWLFVEQGRAIPGFSVDLKGKKYARFFDFQHQLQDVIEACQREDVDAVFMHGIFFDWQKDLIKQVGDSKHIAWKLWGGDLYNPIRTGNPMYDIVSYVDSVHARVAGDYEIIKETYGKKQFYRFGYVFPGLYGDLPASRDKVNPPLIIIGNSGDSTNEHEKILETLSGKVDILDYQLLLPVSYNFNPAYRKHLLKKIDQFGLKNNTTLSERFIPPREYIDLVMRAQFLITAHNRQQALGNILASIYSGNNTFLRKHITMNDKARINPAWTFLEDHGLTAEPFESLEKRESIGEIGKIPKEVTERNQRIIREKIGLRARAAELIEACHQIVEEH